MPFENIVETAFPPVHTLFSTLSKTAFAISTTLIFVVYKCFELEKVKNFVVR